MYLVEKKGLKPDMGGECHHISWLTMRLTTEYNVVLWAAGVTNQSAMMVRFAEEIMTNNANVNDLTSLCKLGVQQMSDRLNRGTKEICRSAIEGLSEFAGMGT